MSIVLTSVFYGDLAATGPRTLIGKAINARAMWRYHSWKWEYKPPSVAPYSLNPTIEYWFVGSSLACFVVWLLFSWVGWLVGSSSVVIYYIYLLVDYAVIMHNLFMVYPFSMVVSGCQVNLSKGARNIRLSTVSDAVEEFIVNPNHVSFVLGWWTIMKYLRWCTIAAPYEPSYSPLQYALFVAIGWCRSSCFV